MTTNLEQDTQHFFSHYRLRRFNKGQILILDGDGASNVYHLVSGRVKMYDVTYRGEEVILNVFKPPSFFPMSLALSNGNNPYIYEAETDIEVHIVPANEVVDWLKTSPEITLDLLTRVYRGVDGLMGRMVQLMSGSAKSRLLYELILEARRFGDLNGSEAITLDINEKDLGSRTGLARETVSREIHKLKDMNLLQVTSKGIRINDLDALSKALSSIL